MAANPLRAVVENNRCGHVSGGCASGLYSVCSANELVLRAVIRHAVAYQYPLIIESTSNQVNQFGGYTGIRPHEFMAQVKRIAGEEGMPAENLIMGGDHLGPLLWLHQSETAAMEKAVEMVEAYTQAGFTKIHLDTSMKLADDPPGPLDPRVCARRGAALAKAVYRTFAGMGSQTAAGEAGPRRPALVIGSEVPIPGGQKNETGGEHGDSVTPTDARDFQNQVSIFRDEFQKAGLDFDDVIAFVVQPGVEFGDDFVCFYDSEKAKPLCDALKTVSGSGGRPGFVFEGHSTDYQTRRHLTELVRDGVAILKVGPGMTFALREALFLLEAVEEILVPAPSRSNLKKALLEEMDKSKKYWEKYYSGTAAEIEYKKLYSYSDRCRYYLPAENVRDATETLLRNIAEVPPALLSQFFPSQYRRYMAGKLQNDPLSLLIDRIGETCADYAAACGYNIE